MQDKRRNKKSRSKSKDNTPLGQSNYIECNQDKVRYARQIKVIKNNTP